MAISFCSFAQTPDSLGIYPYANIAPEFKGGEEALFRFIFDSISYPEDAFNAGKSGKVQLRAVIDEAGAVSEVKVLKSVYPSLDAEAIRIIQLSSGKWQSGMIEGKAVKTYKYIPVSFKIDTTRSAIAKEDILFIGGDSALDAFVKDHMDASNIPKEECCPSVTMSIQFNGINQISSMISVFDCESKPLADEAIRLIRLTQGKWYRPLDNINSNIITRKVTIRFPANANSIRRNIAQNSFKNDIVYDANEKDSVFHKGYLEFMQGKYSLALITFESCISKQPQYIAARYMRANCYIKLNQHNYACDDLEWLVHKNLGGGVIDELYKRYCLDGAVKKNEPIIRNGGFSKFRSK